MLDRMTPVVKNLVIINVLVFLAQQALPQMQFWFMGHYPLSPDFYPWQMVTYMFMHGGFTHLLFNMFALVVFGSALERVWGEKRFLIYYMVCECRERERERDCLLLLVGWYVCFVYIIK